MSMTMTVDMDILMAGRDQALGSTEPAACIRSVDDDLECPGTPGDGNTWDREAVLVEGIKRREEQAFMELVERFHSPLLRMALTFVHCEAVAEEMVQETWMAVLDGVNKFEGRSSLKTWIFKILTNRAKTQGVRESRYVEFPKQSSCSGNGGVASGNETGTEVGGEVWPWSSRDLPSLQTNVSPERQIMNKELVEQIYVAIKTLPILQRKVILMRDVEGFESGEVCRMLGLSETNQRVLLHRARTKVRKTLEQSMERSLPHPSHHRSLQHCA